MLTAELKTKIEATASLLSTGFTVYRGQLPAEPDRVVALFETGGLTELRDFAGGVVEQVGLQVVVRGAADDYDVARLQIERLYQTLSAWGAFTVSSVRYLNFAPQQNPFLRRRDGNKRAEFAVNFIVQKELSPTS